MRSNRSLKFAFASLVVLPNGQGASALNPFAKKAHNNMKSTRRLKGIRLEQSHESFNAFSFSYGYSSPVGGAKTFTYLSEEEFRASNDVPVNPINPSQAVSTAASSLPINAFTLSQTSQPSSTPTYTPTSTPSSIPTHKPTSKPTSTPTKMPLSSAPVPKPNSTIPTRTQAQEALVQHKNASSSIPEQAAETVEGSTAMKGENFSLTSSTTVAVIAGAACVGFLSIGAAIMVMRRQQLFTIPR